MALINVIQMQKLKFLIKERKTVQIVQGVSVTGFKTFRSGRIQLNESEYLRNRGSKVKQ